MNSGAVLDRPKTTTYEEVYLRDGDFVPGAVLPTQLRLRVWWSSETDKGIERGSMRVEVMLTHSPRQISPSKIVYCGQILPLREDPDHEVIKAGKKVELTVNFSEFQPYKGSLKVASQ